MSTEDYIRGLADKDLQREINRRQKESDNRQHREQQRVRDLEREAQEARDRRFAESTGVTWEQYQKIEDYVSDKIYAKL